MKEALIISLKLASLTTLILLFFSLIIGYILAFYSFKGKSIVEAIIFMPILLPPTVLGFYLIYLFNPESPLGKLFNYFCHKSLLFSFEAILLASVIYSLPFGVFPIRDAFQAVDHRYVEISYIFGYSKLESFVKVILPLSWGGILTSCALVFAHTMGEFGVILMVGGNIPGETKTLSIYIYDEVQALNYSEANRASLLLFAVSLVALSVVSLLRRWKEETL